MTHLRLGRYLVEWVALLLGLALLGELVGVQLDPPIEGYRRSAGLGLLVVGLADPVVYATVARGLVIDPRGFMLRWGLSLLGKLAWYGITSAAVIVAGLVVKEVFLLAMAAAFAVFTMHQVLRLVRLAGPEGDRT